MPLETDGMAGSDVAKVDVYQRSDGRWAWKITGEFFRSTIDDFDTPEQAAQAGKHALQDILRKNTLNRQS